MQAVFFALTRPLDIIVSCRPLSPIDLFNANANANTEVVILPWSLCSVANQTYSLLQDDKYKGGKTNKQKSIHTMV